MIRHEIITRKELLRRSSVEYADYSINHVLGCAHGCTYPCYAFTMAKRFGWVKTYNEWRRPCIISNVLPLLDKELPVKKNKITMVHLSFMTDPFMVGYPTVTALTHSILARLNEAGVKAQTLTKGRTPESLTSERYNTENIYGISLVSLNDQFRRTWEPFTARYGERIAALRILHEVGLRTWVSIEPYPTPNITSQDLNEVLEAISFVDRIVFGRWNYNKLTKGSKLREFYQECADAVINFCTARSIEYHIKEGT